MGLQALAVRQHGRSLTKYVCTGFGHLNQAAALLKIVDSQRRRKPRCARSRQHMVGTGAIVAQAFAGERAQKNRASVDQQRLPSVRLTAADL